MNPSDIPPTVFIRNALEAASKAQIEATVIYVVEKNGKRITRVDTNAGPIGMARHLATARVGDGAVERAAIALHTFRIQLPDNVDETTRAEMDKCPLCGTAEAWSDVSEPDREGHYAIVKFVLGHALAAPPAAAGLVSV